MDSKLVEEIEECLAEIRDGSTGYLDPAKRDAYIEAERLLQRCLESLRWIPVEERLPEPETLVLVSGGLAVFGHDGVWYSMTGDDSHRPIQWEVTHWLPIPQ